VRRRESSPILGVMHAALHKLRFLPVAMLSASALAVALAHQLSG
jgi:hypothetical protein